MKKQFHQFLDPLSLPEALGRTVVAIGNFDGVHLGHLALLDKTCDLATKAGASATVLTFSPHPRRYFQPETLLFQLTSENLKAGLIAEAGVDAMITLSFDATLAVMSAKAFIDDILVKRLRASSVVIGHDFHFGYKRLGTPELLAAMGRDRGFDTHLVRPHMTGGEIVSSSRIRALLTEGDIAGANHLLGREWSIESEVLHGEKRGRELGYPTANLHLEPHVKLKYGIYAVRVDVDSVNHNGVASFGSRPTFDDGIAKLEVHLFDYSGDLYGKKITIHFVGYIRSERKFDDIAALIKQMDADSLRARQMLAR